MNSKALFFRGDEQDNPITVDTTVMEPPRYDSQLKILNIEEVEEVAAKRGDIMKIYSTPEKTISRRYDEKGSPLIQCFSQTIIDLFESRKLHETTFPNIAETTMYKVCDLYPGMQPVIEHNSLSRTFYLPAIGNFLASFSNTSSILRPFIYIR